MDEPGDVPARGCRHAEQIHGKKARTAIEAHKASLAEQGLAIVPRMPTDGMNRAGTMLVNDLQVMNAAWPSKGVWQAMIAAYEEGKDAADNA